MKGIELVLAAALLALLAGCRQPEQPPRWPEPGAPEIAAGQPLRTGAAARLYRCSLIARGPL